MFKGAYIVLTLVVLSFIAKADVVLPNIFAHHMVLQRDKPIVIWGTASAGELINVEFSGEQQQTTADTQGNWKLQLKPLAANAKGKELTIKGNNTIVLKDVLVGEVWLCSGQSNMEYQMRKLEKEATKPAKGDYYPQTEVKEANNPAIRIFLVNRKQLGKPDDNYDGWDLATGKALSNFSAAGYFFAKEINSKLGVPVGIISSAVSGSRIEPWVKASAFEEGYFKGEKVSGDPGKFFDTMIAPLAPFAIKGFLWYQGETNTFLNEKLSYAYKMQTLINSWRNSWNDKQLPFYFTQIAPFLYSKGGEGNLSQEALPELREAQTAVLALPQTGMIITTDLNDNLNDIHPTYKWEIGRRLALQALNKTYGIKDIVADGPIVEKVDFKKHQTRVSYKNAQNGLISNDGKALTWFEVAGEDGVYHPATAKIKSNKIVLKTAKVNHPTQMRFAWNEAAQPNLYNKYSLPAAPYRTNNQITGNFKVSDN